MRRCVIDNWEEPLRGGVFVVGVESALDPHFTPDLVQVDVQAGGYACAHFTVTGLLFRLADAPAPRQPLAPLLESFASLGESHSPGEAPLQPQLDDYTLTWGEPIDVRPLNRVLAKYVDVPSLERGCEAFVRGSVGEPPAAWFRDWPRWHPERGLSREWDEVQEQLISAVALTQQPLEVFLLWENSD